MVHSDWPLMAGSNAAAALSGGGDGGESSTRPTVGTTEVGIVVEDPIERSRELWHTTPAPPGIERIEPDAIPAPVSDAVALDVEELQMGRPGVVIVRDSEWNGLAEISENETATYEGEVLLQVAGQLKQYFLIEGEVTVSVDDDTRLSIAPGSDVLLGVRSTHSRPAATVTTTDEPADMMAAFSTFGAALKTTSAERSWPSLRGHPPLIERGDALSIPAELEPPVPEIEIEVPEHLPYVYPTVPLAYYLGARIRPGPIPRLRTTDGWSYELAPEEPTDVTAFEERIRETLQQVFLLEAVSRTDGMMQIPLDERAAVEDRVDVDLDRIYELPPVERLKTCLSVPHESIEDRIPEWDLVAHLRPDPDHARLLPYLVEDLALVRTHGDADRTTIDDSREDEELEAIQDLLRSRGGLVYRSTSSNREIDAIQIKEDMNVAGVAWAGELTPVRSTHISPTAFENRLASSDPSEAPIDVTVVVNDSLDGAETDITEVYGTGPTTENIPFEVTLYRDLSTDALRTRLQDQCTDFFHYIGHADAEGLRCADGRLDLATLESANLDAFLLNACQSYEQGLNLIEAGAVGGIVTLRDVPDVTAGPIGRDLARLLNSGYPLRAALAIVRDHSVLSGDYLVIGDGSTTLAPSDTAVIYRIERTGEDRFRFQLDSFATSTGVGGFIKVHLDHPELGYLLTGNESPVVEVPQEKLESVFRREQVPVSLSGHELCWSMELDLDDVN